MEFDNAKIIVQKRKNGLQPAIFIIDEENTVHMVTITPDRNFDITNEGHIGERYDENGNWVGYSKTTINFDNTFFVKMCKLSSWYPYRPDWVECIIHCDSSSENPYLIIIPCDDEYECVKMHIVNFKDMVFDGRAIENFDNRYYINTYDCYEHLCGGAYLHHSAHYIDKK